MRPPVCPPSPVWTPTSNLVHTSLTTTMSPTQVYGVDPADEKNRSQESPNLYGDEKKDDVADVTVVGAAGVVDDEEAYEGQAKRYVRVVFGY